MRMLQRIEREERLKHGKAQAAEDSPAASARSVYGALHRRRAQKQKESLRVSAAQASVAVSRRRTGAAPMTPPGEPKPADPPIDMAVADTRWLSLFLSYCQLLLIGLLLFCFVMCDVHCLSLAGWMACA